MQWKKTATIAALGVILLVGILVACNRPPPVTPPSTVAVTTPAPATFSARTATPVPPIVSVTSTPVATSTYIATAYTMTPTPRATATISPTALTPTNMPTAVATPTTAPTPTAVVLDPHTGVAHVSSGGIALAQLIAITGGLVLLFGILYRKVGRRK